MESLSLITANIALDVCAAFIFTVLFFANQRSAKKDCGNRVFSWLLVFNIIASFTNGTAWLLDGRESTLAYLFSYTINFVDMSGIVFVGFWWILYVDYMIFGKEEQLSARAKFYIAPAVIVVFLCVINIFYPVYYYIDEQNIFHRSESVFAYIPYIISSGYIIYAEVLLFVNRKTISTYRYYLLMGFILLPGIATYYQMTHFGVSVECISLAGSLLVIYVSLQSDANINASRELQKYMHKQLEYQTKLEKAMEEAMAASKEKSSFMSHMSHDIRTPLNGIAGMTEIAEQNLDKPEIVQNCLNKISLSTKHLSALVNDVLDISRIENGEKTVSNDKINIVTVFQDIINISHGLLEDRKIEFIVEQLPVPHPFVYGDSIHLRQILLNIIQNAIKFTPDGGKVQVDFENRYSETKNIVYFKFIISDSGVGIAPEFLSHVFEPFSQELQSARTYYAGTGLGMTIAKSLSDLMGGTIDISSEKGSGTKVTLEIPLVIDKASEAKHQKDFQKDQALTKTLAGSRVLIVEDNEINRTFAKFLLESKKVEVDWAENGQIGYQKIVTSEPGYYSFVLMDIMMPVMNGYEATRAIRSMNRPDCKKIPIIAMTANAFAEDIELSKQAGMNAHIAKPIESSLFFDTINKCLIHND